MSARSKSQPPIPGLEIQAKPESKFREFSDGWCSLWRARFNERYPYSGRDAKAASILLKDRTAAEVLDVVRLVFEQTEKKRFFYCCITVHVWDLQRWWLEIRNELGVLGRKKVTTDKECGNSSYGFAP